MSLVAKCPTCGGKSKIKEDKGITNFITLQDKDVLKKVGQLKKAMQKFKDKAEALEQELEALKTK